MALPETPSIFIRPFAEDGKLSYYWYGAPASTFTLNVSGTGYTSSFTYTDAGNHTITDLSNGVLYSATLTNDDGEQSSLPATFRTVQPGLRPSVPQAAAIIKENGRVRISWDPPASDGGAVIGWYVVKDADYPNQRYNTYGFNNQLSFDYQTGHDKYILQAVNDPGYSPGVLMTVRGPNFVLFNRFLDNDTGNFRYQIFDTATQTFMPSFDSGINNNDYYADNDYPEAQIDDKVIMTYYSQNQDENGYYSYKFQIINTNGTIIKTFNVADTDNRGWDANYTKFMAYTQDVSTTMLLDVYTFDSPSDTFQTYKIPFHANTQYINNDLVIKDKAIIDIYSNNTNLHYITVFSKDWVSTIEPLSGAWFNWPDSNADYMTMASYNSTGVFDKIYVIGERDLFSTVAFVKDTYTDVNDNRTQGIQSRTQNFLMRDNNSGTYDLYNFRKVGSTLTTLVFPDILTTSSNYNFYQGNTDNDGSNITNTTDTFTLEQYSGWGQYLTPVTNQQLKSGTILYTLLEGETEIRSTIFEEGNYTYDTRVTDGLVNTLYANISTVGTVSLAQGGSTITTVIDDLVNFNSDNFIQNTDRFNSNAMYFLYPSTLGATSNVIISADGTKNAFSNTAPWNYTYSYTNLIHSDTFNSTIYYYSTNNLQSTMINFPTSYYEDIRSGEYPEVSSPNAIWYIAADYTGISTVCLRNGVLGEFASVPFENGASVERDAFQDTLAIGTYSWGSSNATVTIVQHTGSTISYTDTQFSPNINLNYLNSTDKLINYNFYDNNTFSSFNITYDRQVSSFYSTIIEYPSTANTFNMFTNNQNDVYWNWY